MTSLSEVKAEALQLADQVSRICGRVGALADRVRETYDGPEWDEFLDQTILEAGDPPETLFLYSSLRVIADEDLEDAVRGLRRSGSATASAIGDEERRGEPGVERGARR